MVLLNYHGITKLPRHCQTTTALLNYHGITELPRLRYSALAFLVVLLQQVLAYFVISIKVLVFAYLQELLILLRTTLSSHSKGI
jgi:hypothetical protein